VTVDPSIRLAEPGDADEIAAMSRELIEHGLPWTWRPARVLGAIRSPETNVAVVRQQGELVAFGIMEYLESDAYLVLLAVDLACRRRGIGSALLRWLEASASVAGAQRIRLHARRDNVAGRAFYNERGYHEVAIQPGRYSAALDGIRLEKWLRPAAPA
jgi:[ribosomal protein S18]-alanine N-acetyltransferase